MELLRKVKRCKHPAVKEAFCLIQGAPALIKDEEGPALENAAKKFYEEKDQKLEVVPTFVMIPHVENHVANPFWANQRKWNSGKNLVRFGHRYLSIHSLCDESSMYESFEHSLKPNIEEWIGFYRDTLVTKKDPHPIGLISFGYINEFNLPEKDFDLSSLVNLTYSLGLHPECVDGINKINLSFDLFNSSKLINSTIKVSVGKSAKPECVKLVVEVYSGFGQLDDFCYNDNIMAKVQALKDHAKDTFFSFATSHLRDDIMIAEYYE